MVLFLIFNRSKCVVRIDFFLLLKEDVNVLLRIKLGVYQYFITLILLSRESGIIKAVALISSQ